MRILSLNLKPRVPFIGNTNPEVIKVEAYGRLFAYDVNSMAVALLDSEQEFDKLRDDKQGWFWYRAKPNFPYGMPGAIGTIVFEATHKCDLRCHYCFVREFYPDDADLSFDAAKQVIDAFAVDGQTNSLGFFGGEPLMAWDLVLQVHAYATAKLRNPLSWSMTTNGTLLTPKRASWLARNRFGFIVSLDGNEQHNALRETVDGRNSYKLVRRGLGLLRDAGISNYTLRGTFTARILDENNPNAVVDRIEHLNQLCDEGFGNHVSVEPVDLSESRCIGKKDEKFETRDKDKLLSSFSEMYYQVAQWFVRRAREGKKPRFHHMGKLFQRLLYAQHGASECGAGHGYLSVSSNGDLYACHREQSSYVGNIWKGGIDERLRAKWLDNRLYQREQCLTCPIRWWCGGGCREASVGAYGNIARPVEIDCAFKWLWFKAQLWVMSELDPSVLRSVLPDPGAQAGRGRGPSTSVPTSRPMPRAILSSPQSKCGICNVCEKK